MTGTAQAILGQAGSNLQGFQEGLIAFAGAAAVGGTAVAGVLAATSAGATVVESGTAAANAANAANATNAGTSSVDFIVDAGGNVFPVPEGATGPTPAANGQGIVSQGGQGGNGLAPNVTDMRAINPNSLNPGGYVNYGSVQANGGWQSVNPHTGQSIGTRSAWWHIPTIHP